MGSLNITGATDTTLAELLAGSAQGTAGTPAGGVQSVQGVAGGTPVPVSMAAVATGGATSTRQDTGNTSLASIDAKIPASPSTAGNQATGNTSLASIAASNTNRVAAAGDVHAPASNTAAIVTYAAAGVSLSHVITGVAWSYSAAPTSGNLKIEDVSGTTVFSVDITAAGPGFIPFPVPKKSAAANTAMIITLAAGGSGVTGKVQALNHWTE